MIPIHFAVKPHESAIKSIPIYTAAGVEPLLRPRHAYEVGQMIGEAVAAYEGAQRVAVFGTGGISHWVGTAEMGRVNEEFDSMVLDKMAVGDVESLIAMSDEYLVDAAGNGSLEIRNWIMAMGASGARGAELICYEPIPEWICGMGVAELKLAG